MYDYFMAHHEDICSEWVYVPVFWTNLQNHPGFQKEKYDILLQQAFQAFPPDTKYMVIVQHDDGPQLTLPPHTTVFGACTGDIPLPLLYEDTNETLRNTPLRPKTILASFVGQATHPIRTEMVKALQGHEDVTLVMKEGWNHVVPAEAAETFIEETQRARFCLAPRGYGRSSFRFFEAMQLGTIPVYVWEEKEWLPYKEELDATRFSVSVHRRELPRLYDILKGISEEEYGRMQYAMEKVKSWFTLEGMAAYIRRTVEEPPKDYEANLKTVGYRG